MDRDLAAGGRRVATSADLERSVLPTSTLSTTPVPVDTALRRMIALGCVVPALVPAAAKTFIALFRPAEAGPMIFLTIGLYAAWVALMILRPWRALLVDLGRLLLAGIPFVVWFLLACVLALVGSTHTLDTPWWALTTAVVCFMGSAAYAEARRSPKRFAFTLATLGVAAVLLVAADRWVTGRVLLTMHHNVFVEHDPVLGWKLRANMTIVRERRGEMLRETINDQGFRARLPTDRPSGVKRVLFVGDSHTEAYGIDDHRTYTALVERRMGQTRPVEVVGLGVAGFSTDQEMLTYVLYGRPYRADLVVLQFCSNDVPFNVLDRYWRGHKPRFERFGDVLLLTNVPVPNIRNTDLFASTLLQRSSIMLSVEHVLRQLTVRHRVRRVADMDEEWRVTALLLRDLDRIVRSDGARLLVFHADRNPQSEAKLQDILATLEIPYLDTTGAYRGDMASYWDGPHWNDKGQEAVANVLGPALLGYL